jgi:hypothetical protein
MSQLLGSLIAKTWHIWRKHAMMYYFERFKMHHSFYLLNRNDNSVRKSHLNDSDLKILHCFFRWKAVLSNRLRRHRLNGLSFYCVNCSEKLLNLKQKNIVAINTSFMINVGFRYKMTNITYLTVLNWLWMAILSSYK